MLVATRTGKACGPEALHRPRPLGRGAVAVQLGDAVARRRESAGASRFAPRLVRVNTSTDGHLHLLQQVPQQGRLAVRRHRVGRSA